MYLLSLLIGLVMLVAGADLLVRGGGQIALMFRVPALVVGLTIVAFGTSTPELFVSATAALDGAGDLALANVNGSNVANIAFVLGLAAVVRPLRVDRRLMRREIPVFLGIQCILPVFAWNGLIGRAEGVALILGGVGYNLWLLWDVNRQRGIVDVEEVELEEGSSLAKNVLILVVGIAVLWAGAQLFVGGATAVAMKLGFSERYVGLTVVALGTSAPEIATALVSAHRGEVDLAIGNSIGSNILNIAMVLGIVAVISPIATHDPNAFKDILVCCAVSILMVPLVLRDGMLQRWEGGVLAAGYVAYLFLSKS